ncbi:MAG: hypothetical protein Q8N23_05315 [Archangium sp.]|nr:hypothetical protein [Archangium sp.]MDP3574560.1 hypothetical protein [Archangium sp.]
MQVPKVESRPRKAKDWLENELSDYSIDVMSKLLDAAKDANQALRSPHLDGLKFLRPSRGFQAFLQLQCSRWSSLSTAQRILVLEAGQAVRHPGLLDAAKGYSLDTKENRYVRTQAVEFVDALGSADDLIALPSSLVAEDSDTGRALIALVLIQLLRRGAISASEARSKAPALSDVLDYTHLLLLEIATYLTLDDAFVVLSELRPRKSHHGASDKVFDAAGKLIQEAPILTASQSTALLAALVSAAKAHDWNNQSLFDKVLRTRTQFRREAYVASLEFDDSDLAVLWIRTALQATDADWIIQTIDAAVAPSERLVVDALFVLRQLPAQDRPGLRSRLESKAPELVRGIEQRQAEHDQRIESLMAEHRATRPKPDVLLSRAVDETLAAEFPRPIAKLHRLAWLCLSDAFRPSDIVGTFDELAPEYQVKIADAVAYLLEAATPSEIPSGSTIPGAVIFEADAFEHIVADRGNVWLTGLLVINWLPAVLRATTDPDHARSIQTCLQRFPEATGAVFLGAVERELRGGQPHAFSAGRAPNELWGLGLAEGVRRLLGNAELPVESRAALLLVLAAHAPGLAIEVAVEWSNQQTASGLRTAAIRVLLACSPESGLKLLEATVGALGPEVLLQVADAFDRMSSLRVSVEEWPEALRERLVVFLFAHAPETEPERDWLFDTLSQLRGTLLRTFFQPRTASSLEVIKRLSEYAPWLLDRLVQEEAEERAETALESLSLKPGSVESKGGSGPPPASPPGNGGGAGEPRRGEMRIPLAYVLKILDAMDFRLARTNADLARLLLEVFGRIGATIAQDLRLLFKTPGWKEHANEDVLQAYIRVRLDDLIPGRFVDREAWMPLNRRVDLRVTTAVVNNKTIGTKSTVHIELKWSDDKRPLEKTASDQLGARYLLPNRSSHGIYVIAWCGHSRPRKRAQETTLRLVRKDIASFQDNHDGYFVDLVVLDAAPPQSTPTVGKESRAKRIAKSALKEVMPLKQLKEVRPEKQRKRGR